MKIVKESIANLERCIENDKVDAVGSMPITMADAFYQSQKNDERLEDAMKETDDVPEPEKVVGAEKQPVPKKPEEPKITLEEGLFEESYNIPSRDKVAKFIEDSTEELLANEGEGGCCRLILDDDLCLYVGWESGFDEDNGHDGWEVCAKIAERNDYDWADFEFLNMPWYPNDGEVWDTSISNPDASDADWFIKSYEGSRDALDNNEIVLESLKKSRSKRLNEDWDWDGQIPEIADNILNKLSGKEEIDHDEYEELLDSAIIDTLGISPEEFREIIFSNSPVFEIDGIEKHYYEDIDPDIRTILSMNGWETIYEGQNEGGLTKNSIEEGKSSKPFVDQEGNVYTDEDRSGGLDSSKDLWTIIYNELAPEHSNWLKRTKIKDIPASKRYDYNDIEFDYDDNILIHADNEEDFELARRVADAYGLEFRNPRKRAYDVDLVGTIVMPKNK